MMDETEPTARQDRHVTKRMVVGYSSRVQLPLTDFTSAPCRHSIGTLFRWAVLVALALAMLPHRNAAAAADLLTSSQRAWLSAHPDLVIGLPSDYPPGALVDGEGHVTGIGPDFVDLLNRRLGTRIRIEPGHWTEIVARAERRELDLLGFTFPLDSYRPKFHFTGPVFAAYYYVYARSDDEHPPTDLAGLTGKRVGYFASTRIVEKLLGGRTDVELVPIPSAEELIVALLSKRIDVVVANFSLEYWRKKTTQIGFRVAALLPEMGGDLVISVRKDWPELRDILDAGLVTITEQERQAILNRWMGSEPDYFRQQGSGPPLDEAEKAWLAAHPVLRVGIDPNWAPIEFVDANGAAQGIANAYMQRIEQLLGIRVETVALPSWSEGLTLLAEGRVDLLPALDFSRKDRGNWQLTEAYVSFPAVIFSAAEVAYLGDLDALQDKLVAVVDGDIVADWIRQTRPGQRLLPVANTREALQRVARGEAFAFVGNLVTTSYYIGQTGLTQIRVAGETPFTYRLAMGVRPDQPILSRLLQKGLDSIPVSEREAIRQAWLSVRYSHDIDYGLLWRVLAGIALVAIAIVAWNRRLAREVERRRQAEAASHQAKEAAERANRAKSEFLAGISHELRTPLNLLLGYATLLEDTEREERARQWLQSLRSAGRTLAALIDDLLDLGRVESGHLRVMPQATDLRQELREIADLYAEAAAAKGLSLSVTAAETLPERLWVDASRLRQIVTNLLANAVKFSETGHIVMQATPALADSGEPRFTVTVTDSGPGIDPEEQQRIFEPFTQGKVPLVEGGAGLGLAIGQRLARLMGGDLTVRSVPGQGSTFTLDLPMPSPPADAPATDAADLRAATTLRHFEPARVLIVDDRADNRELLRAYLGEQPLDLIEAADGASALAHARDRRPDVILMDIVMPGVDGITAARRLRDDAETAAIPLIAVTATLVPDADPALRDTFDAVLHKPVSRDALLDCLGRWLAPRTDAAAPAPARHSPAPITLSSTLVERLRALHPPYVSINELQAFAAALQSEANGSADAALQEVAAALQRAVTRCDVQELRRQVESLQHAAACAPPPAVSASETRR
jgi:two-component system sensor histidine kinase EvgS